MKHKTSSNYMPKERKSEGRELQSNPFWSYQVHSLHACALHQMKASLKHRLLDRSDDQLELALGHNKKIIIH